MFSALRSRPGTGKPPRLSPAPRLGLVAALDRRELRGLVLGDGPAEQVADAELHRREQRGHRHAERQPAPVVGVAAAAQQPDGVDRGDAERRREQRADDHVRGLGRPRRVEHRRAAGRCA